MSGARLRHGAIAATLMLLAVPLVACARGGEAANPVLPPATAAVTRTTLVETRTETGSLGYGEVQPVALPGSGTITWLPPLGADVGVGEALLRVDERPVVALRGAVPVYRPLEVLEGEPLRGADVLQLHQNLSALGFGGFEFDGFYDDATAQAVAAWQRHVGLPDTGRIEPGEVVFLALPVRVAEHHGRVGEALRGGSVLGITGSERLVTVRLRVGDLWLAKIGGSVPVHVPGAGTVHGTVARVGSVVRDGAVEVTIRIEDQAALGGLTAAPVEVEFVSQARADVLVVPVSALLALAEGGYGVEVVENDSTRIVAVSTGMFAAGRVEVSGPGIAPGVMVGVPR
jgi:membrane fusion protein, multidrug efflux system